MRMLSPIMNCIKFNKSEKNKFSRKQGEHGKFVVCVNDFFF